MRSKAGIMTAAIVLAALPCAFGGSLARADTVTFVESVDCASGVCEIRRRTELVVAQVREKVGGGICVEYVRRIVGLKKIPTVDPATPLEIPQYEVSNRREIRCDVNTHQVADVPPISIHSRDSLRF